MASALPYAQLGPDKDDLHSARPFFILPIPKLSRTDEATVSEKEKDLDYVEAKKRIRQWISQSKKPYTDVYVMSHGWHRNYYSAVASYDRLISRTIRMRMRGRLLSPPNYNPLFLCLHWSSEVGKDTWTDLAGRHNKPDFLKIARERFQETVPNFQNTFEDAFEMFAALSAPDTTFDDWLGDKSDKLGQTFKHMRLKEEGPNSPDHELLATRIAAAWACYHESAAKGIRGAQRTKPAGFAGWLLRLSLLGKFIVGAVGFSMIIGLPIVKKIPIAIAGWIADLYQYINRQLPNLDDNLTCILGAIGTYLAIGLGAFLLFTLFTGITITVKNRGAKYGVGWVTGVFWLISELAFAVPLVVTLLFTYATSFRLFRHWLFSERRRRNNKFRFSLNYWLSRFARVPNRMLEYVDHPESFWAGISRAIDSQLAFFEMQRRGVTSGFLAAKALDELLDTSPLPDDVRIHLVGHSFGGLVAINATRELARGKSNGWKATRKVHSLCTVEGAYASGWFGIEQNTIEHVQSTLATIFSEADTATGFYYPAANAARLAAGSVGFSEIQMAQAPIGVPCMHSCRKDHIHRPLPYASLADAPVLPGARGIRSVLNIDASKMIYEGAIASGGGHTDIYKDDVVNLLWAVMHRDEMQRRLEENDWNP